MNDPETHPTDEQLAALMAAADKDAPPPDQAFLATLRDKSLAAFETATAPTDALLICPSVTGSQFSPPSMVFHKPPPTAPK